MEVHKLQVFAVVLSCSRQELLSHDYARTVHGPTSLTNIPSLESYQQRCQKIPRSRGIALPQTLGEMTRSSDGLGCDRDVRVRHELQNMSLMV